MRKLRVVNVVGARPNFMKVAPIHDAMIKSDLFQPVLVHTGQHYDTAMSRVFLEDLGLPEPDVYLGVGSGSHAEQTAKIMIEFERTCATVKPDLVLVVGDVNSTLACSIVASKLRIPVAHVEAGLRSNDRSMPEEINRLLTDALSSYLFTHSPEADANLLREGIAKEKIFYVGNVMVDSLVNHVARATEVYTQNLAKDHPPRSYGLVTLHRPSNVDAAEQLNGLITSLRVIAKELPLLFPVHPRTRYALEKNGFASDGDLFLTEPLGYLEFLGLLKNARIVITDSGGIQEETSFLDVPCVTVRDNTERPVTVSLGSNILAGSNPKLMLEACLKQLADPKRASAIPMWDGCAAERIIDVLESNDLTQHS